MVNIQMVDLFGQYQRIKSEVDQALAEVINNSSYINGPQVSEFSQNLAEYMGCKYVIPCANGTDALQIALMALKLEPGDEVITVPFTFIATAEVIGLLRLKPVFIDVEPDSYMMDVGQLETVITTKTKCIIPVHLFGQTAPMNEILEIANKHGIAVLEDNAQAIGSDYTLSSGETKKSGTLGDMGTTSFYPAKNLGAMGDGGAIFTNSDKLADRSRLIANHGSSRRYYHDEVGVNSRLDSMQAAVLNIKLKHLDEYCAARQKAAAHYDQALAGLEGIQVPARIADSTHVFHQYTLKVEAGRDTLAAELKNKGIPNMIYYPVPLHLNKAYESFGYKAGDFPISEALSEKVISLPMHTELSTEQLVYITETVEKYLSLKSVNS